MPLSSSQLFSHGCPVKVYRSCTLEDSVLATDSKVNSVSPPRNSRSVSWSLICHVPVDSTDGITFSTSIALVVATIVIVGEAVVYADVIVGSSFL